MSFFSAVEAVKISCGVDCCRLPDGGEECENRSHWDVGLELEFSETRLLVVGKMSYREMLTSAESYLGASEMPSSSCG